MNKHKHEHKEVYDISITSIPWSQSLMLLFTLTPLGFCCMRPHCLSYSVWLISLRVTLPSIGETSSLYKHLTICQHNEHSISPIRFATVPGNIVLCHTGFAIRNSRRTPSSSAERSGLQSWCWVNKYHNDRFETTNFYLPWNITRSIKK